MYENYISLKVVVDDVKIAEIFDRLDKAKEEIRKCYFELSELEVLKFESPAGICSEGNDVNGSVPKL